MLTTLNWFVAGICGFAAGMHWYLAFHPYFKSNRTKNLVAAGVLILASALNVWSALT